MKTHTKNTVASIPFLLAILSFLFASPASATTDAAGLEAELIAEQTCSAEALVTLHAVNIDALPLAVSAPKAMAMTLATRPTPKPAPQPPEDEDDPATLPVDSATLQTQSPRLSPLPYWQPAILEAGDSFDVSFALAVPQEDGLYRERVLVPWAYLPSAPVVHEIEHDTEAVLIYQVENGCMKVLEPQTFEKLSDPTSAFRVMHEELIDVISTPGWADTDLFERSEAEAQTLALPSNSLMPLFNDDPPTTGGEIVSIRYCIRARYKDNFQSCPADATGMKWWRPYCDGSSVPLLGLEVALFDRDSNSADDFIGLYALHYDGLSDYACVDIEWPQDLRGESYPDIYARTDFDVIDTEFGATKGASLCTDNQVDQGDCNDKFDLDWRDNYSLNVGAQGTVYRSVNFGNLTDDWNRRAMTMASVQKTLRSFQGKRMTGNINVWWDGTLCSTACSYDDHWLIMTRAIYRDWFAGPHEVGHNYQKQLFEQDHLYGDACPSPHSITVANNEPCATREGWAEFFSTLTWFTGPDAKNGLGTPVYRSSDVEASASGTTCSQASITELQVIRTFWDLYDKANDGLDTGDVTRFDLLRTWDEFKNGSANHKDQETGSDGGNLRDFKHNGSWLSGFQGDIEDALKQNDTDCQSSS